MAGLVLEGGSMRGMFSAGVMDALLDCDIHFDYVIGVSAGITNAVSYISRQKERNLEVIRKYRHDKRYMSPLNFIRHRSLFGLDFLFDDIPNKLVPFDYEAFSTFTGILKVGITDATTGEAVYKTYENRENVDRKAMLLRATCAIPIYSPSIEIEGNQYYDGAMADSIPIKKSVADGNKKNLVVLTQPKGFEKTLSRSDKLCSLALRKKYPQMAKLMLERPKMYNDTLCYIESIEAESPDDIIVIRPEYSLNSFESDIAVIEKSYRHGYDTAVKHIDTIKFLQG